MAAHFSNEAIAEGLAFCNWDRAKGRAKKRKELGTGQRKDKVICEEKPYPFPVVSFVQSEEYIRKGANV
jgi:hypothetical protein